MDGTSGGSRARVVRLSLADWELRESGPAEAESTVLCLPGAFGTAAFYEELMNEPTLAGIRLVAATLPGQGGTAAPEDLGIENYARLAAELAADFGCDAVVGHSVGANVALEMAATGGFSGPLVLLAPSLSRGDESIYPRALDRLGAILGHLPYSILLRVVGSTLGGGFPPGRRDAIVAELRKNDPRAIRRHVHSYLDYLDRHGSVASRLCEAGVPAWVVYGDRDDVGLAEDERRILEACPRTRVVAIPRAGHFTLNERPELIAGVVLQALGRTR